MSDLTPMMRQYLEIKADYPDTILFFRMGDFYEMFLDDAVKASRILDIALTSRNKSANGADVPLCGVPYHSVNPYIARMIEAGEKVAICEQVEDPKTAKGIVKRRVVRVVTPGLVVDTESLTPKENNYLLSIFAGSGTLWGLACLDLSTGEFRVTELATADAAVAEVVCVNPREIILPASFRDSPRMKELGAATSERIITYLDDWVFDTDYAHRLITGHFGVASPDSLGCAGLKKGVPAAGAILHYLNETQMGKAGHIRTIIPYKNRGIPGFGRLHAAQPGIDRHPGRGEAQRFPPGAYGPDRHGDGGAEASAMDQLSPGQRCRYRGAPGCRG